MDCGQKMRFTKSEIGRTWRHANGTYHEIDDMLMEANRTYPAQISRVEVVLEGEKQGRSVKKHEKEWTLQNTTSHEPKLGTLEKRDIIGGCSEKEHERCV